MDGLGDLGGCVAEQMVLAMGQLPLIEYGKMLALPDQWPHAVDLFEIHGIFLLNRHFSNNAAGRHGHSDAPF
jgi:hypothetical protein